MTGARGAGRSRGGTRRLRTPGSVPSWWEPPPADRFGRRAPRAGRPDPAQPADRRSAGGGHHRAGPGPGRHGPRPGRRLALGRLATALLAPLLVLGPGHLLIAATAPVTAEDPPGRVGRESVAVASADRPATPCGWATVTGVTGADSERRTFTVLAWPADRRVVLYVPEIEASTLVADLRGAEAAAASLIADLTGLDAAAVRCEIAFGRPPP